VLGRTGLVYLSTKLSQLVVHQRPQLNHLALGHCAPFPLRPELRAVLVGQGFRPGELGSEHAHQFAQHHGFPSRLSDRLYGCLYGCLYGWLNARLYGRMNGRGRLLAFRKLDQGPPVVPALVTPAQASRPLPGGFGRDAQPLAGLLVGQPFPYDALPLRPFMLSGLSDCMYGLLYASVRVADWQPGAGQGKDTAGGRWQWQPPRLACFFVQPFVRRPARQGLLGRRCGGTPFVPTPTARRGAQRRARAAPFGAGTGATRSHAQPPLGGEHGEHGEDPPLARSEHRGTQPNAGNASYPQRKSSISLKFRFRGSQASDSTHEKGVNCEETGGLL
jgi:hypothetical protein